MLNDTLRIRKQRGFTLIELVIVIVIIGILAAIALPKFASLASDARKGTIKGVAGSLQSANVTIYAASQIQGKGTGATAENVNVCGVTTVSAQFGYAASLTELRKCVEVSPAENFDFATDTTQIRVEGATTEADCSVDYSPASALGGAPTYLVVTTGC